VLLVFNPSYWFFNVSLMPPNTWRPTRYDVSRILSGVADLTPISRFQYGD